MDIHVVNGKAARLVVVEIYYRVVFNVDCIIICTVISRIERIGIAAFYGHPCGCHTGVVHL